MRKKPFLRGIMLLIVCSLTFSCARTGPLVLSDGYIKQQATPQVPTPPSSNLSTNVNVVQSGI